MESILSEVNAVLGVTGSFVCLPDGKIAACAMPQKYSPDDLSLAARLTSQTFQALELSGQRVAETTFLFGAGRLVLKNFRSGVLVIVCTRSINLPLLNLTANVAVKKLIAKTRVSRTSGPAPEIAKAEVAVPLPDALPDMAQNVAPSSVTSAPVIPFGVAISEELPPILSDLEEEAQRILQASSRSQTPLWVMDPVAIWRRCRGRRRLLSTPRLRQIELVGKSESLASTNQCLLELGYKITTRPSASPTTRRLTYGNPAKSIDLVLFLDTFEMYHHFEFGPFLKPNEPILPPTALALVRLQLVDMPDDALSDLAALFIEYDVSLVPKENQIDASCITPLCVDDWGWYKSISMNLDQLVYFAEESLLSAERNVVIERVRRLQSCIDATPKSLLWQARARLGEGIRWYESPPDLNQPVRPDMAIG
jgi:predicted regulator of Ras-like GTPase activity (Roadblock/LC7/MglB family)